MPAAAADTSNVTALPTKPRPQKAALVAGDQPRAIVPSNIEQVWRFAELAVKSGLAPKDLDTAEKCSVAILHGLEVGLPPMQALQRICVINGRPTIWGDAVLGLVRASGLLESIQEEITGDGEGMVAACTVKRVGEAAVTKTFSATDAKTAGLWTKAGPWKQYPNRMLQMRARAFALRDVFPDVTGGMYLREEIDERELKDVTPRSGGEPLEPPEPPPSIAPPATTPQPVTEPAAEPEAPAEPPEPPEPGAAATSAPPMIEGKAVEVFDVECWLGELAGAFSGCEDAVQLADAQMKYMQPHKEKVSGEDFERAGKLAVEAFARITRGG